LKDLINALSNANNLPLVRDREEEGGGREGKRGEGGRERKKIQIVG